MTQRFSIANSGNLEGARIGFHAAFLESLGQTDASPLDQLFLEVSSSTGLEEWNWLGDLPDFEEWKGDRFLAELGAFKLRIENKNWASGIRVHQNEIKDDKLGLIRTKIDQLARKARTHRRRRAMQLLINGFAGNAFTDVGNGLGYDGAFFFSTSHATGSNKLTSVLDAAGLAAAELLLASQTNFSGSEPIEVGATHLIVGPKLAATANQLMTAATIAGDDNMWKGRFTVVVEPLLRGTYDDYWFLADMSQSLKPMIYQEREAVSTSAIVGDQGGTNDSIPRFQRGEIWFGAEARYNVAYFEHRLIVGSQVA